MLFLSRAPLRVVKLSMLERAIREAAEVHDGPQLLIAFCSLYIGEGLNLAT